LAAIVVQVIESVVTLGESSAHAVPAGGLWVSGGSVLLLLAGAVLQRRASPPQASVPDRPDQAEADPRVAEFPAPLGWLGEQRELGNR
jgi:hypothetical protein